MTKYLSLWYTEGMSINFVKDNMTFKSKVNWKEELPVIKELGSLGYSMASLAEKYGVSRQRMKQVVDKHIPEWYSCYGNAAKRQLTAKLHFEKWGVREDTLLYSAQREKFRAKASNAKRIGWEWSVNFGDLQWNTHCPILGMELDYFAETRQENSPSFDQIDAGKGYIKGNVQIVSWRANRIKNNGTAGEHRRIADYLDSLQHTNTCM